MGPQNVYTATYMQSLMKGLQAGVQMSYMPHMGECMFGYAGYYSIGDKMDH